MHTKFLSEYPVKNDVHLMRVTGSFDHSFRPLVTKLTTPVLMRVFILLHENECLTRSYILCLERIYFPNPTKNSAVPF